MNGRQLAHGLGWFSVGLGLAEIVAPQKLSKAIGVHPHRFLLPALGLRELTSGIGILSDRKPAGWLWSRVAGDAMDLALLGAAICSRGTSRGRLAAATAAVLGVTALDVFSSQQHTRGKTRGIPERQQGQKPRGNHLIKTITVDRSPEEVYRFWRNFENLPRFMLHLRSVTVTGGNRSHWIAKGPAGKEVEWDAEIVTDKPGELISWRALPGSDVEHAGSVRFERASGGRGTVIRVHMEYDPPGGALGRTVAKLFAESPEKQVAVDLRRFKQYMETGEIARTEGQSAGRSESTSRKFDDLVRA